MREVRVSQVCKVEGSKCDPRITGRCNDQCDRSPPETRDESAVQAIGEYYEKECKHQDDEGHDPCKGSPNCAQIANRIPGMAVGWVQEAKDEPSDRV